MYGVCGVSARNQLYLDWSGAERVRLVWAFSCEKDSVMGMVYTAWNLNRRRVRQDNDSFVPAGTNVIIAQYSSMYLKVDLTWPEPKYPRIIYYYSGAF